MVVENVVSSVSSSHLFDFVHGWLYVLGVGIIGGMVRKSGNGAANIRSPTIVKTNGADPMCGIDDGKESKGSPLPCFRDKRSNRGLTES